MANEVVEQKATAVAKKEGTLKDLIKSDSFTDAVQGFFTVEANRKRFVQSAVNALTKTPKLSTCDKMSFFGSLISESGTIREKANAATAVPPYRSGPAPARIFWQPCAAPLRRPRKTGRSCRATASFRKERAPPST